jgi:branched-subunit amino acid transport protein
MTSAIWLILAMGAGVYALRLSGLVLRDIRIPPAWERGLGHVPVALLTALVVASLTAQSDGSPVRLIAAAGAAVVARLTGQMWACILAGMAVYWALSLI